MSFDTLSDLTSYRETKVILRKLINEKTLTVYDFGSIFGLFLRKIYKQTDRER